MKADLQILVFVEARKSSEIICKLVREKLTKQVTQSHLLCDLVLGHLSQKLLNILVCKSRIL